MINSTKYETSYSDSALNDYSKGYDEGAKIYSGLDVSEQGTHYPIRQESRSDGYNEGLIDGFDDAKELDGWPVTHV